MTWPVGTVSTTHVDADSDSPLSFRADLKSAIDKLNEMIGHDVVSKTLAETLTNKRITRRIVSMADATSITPTADTADVNIHTNTQAAGTLTVNSPTGTPTDGQLLTLRIKSTNVQTYVWNSIFRGPLPVASRGGGETDYYDFIYNVADTKWDYARPPLGKQTVWMPVAGMMARTTAGPSLTTSELATNKIMRRTLDFDPATDEFAQFQMKMPKGWNEGSVTARFIWTAVGGTNGQVVRWAIQTLAHSNDDPLDAAFNATTEVDDAKLADNDVHLSDLTAAIVVTGAAEHDLITFQVSRNADHANDTLTVDALLLGVEVIVTFNASEDG